MAQLIGYLSEGEQLQGRLSDPDRLVGELSMPTFLGGGLSEEVKQALLDLFQHLAYTDADGQEYYDALYNAFYPPAELVRISAVYTQSGSVFPDTPLDDLKDDLVVTAHYSDGTSEAVTTYTLSGTLTAGTSVVTVTYEDKTTTFSVTVSAPAVLSSITAVYTQSGTVYPTDSLDSLKPDLVVTAHYSDSSTATVTTYTLSGSLTVGTSTITVTYSGKTTTFNVTVTAVPVLDSITAVYTQSGTVYDTDSLDSLKADLVVTAVYTDSSTEVVPSTDYTLSGTLTVGTSTITVSYEGKTTTFNVTVTDVLFTVSNHEVDRTSKTAVVADIRLLESDKSFSIVFDGIQAEAIPKDAAVRVLFCATIDTNWKGIFWGGSATAGAIQTQWMNSGTSGKTLFARNASNKRFRLVLTHAQGGNANYYYKVDDGTMQTDTFSQNFLAQSSPLYIGGASGTYVATNWIGTITNCTIYNRVLTSDEINTFMA